MNDPGPLAVPPLESRSLELRMVERLEPVPDPHLKSIPSVFARVRMDSMVSSTELMKQAEHCGFFSMPQLNHTGELNEAHWFSSRNVSSSRKVIASSVEAKYFPSTPQRVMVSTTRETSCLPLRSRSEPVEGSSGPWEY